MRWNELAEELALLDQRLAILVEAMQQGSRADDSLAPFRGLVVSDEEALLLSQSDESLLTGDVADRIRAAAPEKPAGAGLLDRLAQRFGLTPVDRLALVACLAAELDRKYEKLYGYLQDDVTRRRPTPGLLLDLAGLNGPERLAALERFLPGAPLLQAGLLTQPDATLPLISRPLQMEPAVVAYLAGHDRPSPGVKPGPPEPDRAKAADLIGPERLAAVEEWLANDAGRGAPVLVLQGASGSGRLLLAAALCRQAGWPLLVLNLAERDGHVPLDLARQALRDAALREGALCLAEADTEPATPAAAGDAESEKPKPLPWGAISEMAEAMQVPLFLTVTRPWQPAGHFRRGRVANVSVEPPDVPVRTRLWTELAANASLAPDADLGEVAERFRLTPGRINDAWRTALDRAALRDPHGPVTRADLLQGCRAQARHGLGKVAKRLRGAQGWDKLVLPDDATTQLFEFCNRLRYRHQVYVEWGFAAGQTRGLGLSAMFEGASGTGKTLAAEVVATELGLDAYRIDLSQVISKYVGETEKNLSKVFAEAEESQALLFFDEADAIFGKRTEVKDAHDRYANIEINYLLQRMEEYDGLVVLATNRADDLDEAFKRRIGFHITFPQPGPEQRRRIWDVHMPKGAPLADDLDLDLVAKRLSVPGGNIRNIVLGAAFLAAAEAKPIGMAHVMRAAAREYIKAGRHVSEAEFGSWYHLVRP
jgi:ATP-dependent 26S proteasome regulatory subunit